MRLLDRFERTEKALIIGSLACLVLCLSLLFLVDKYAGENVVNEGPLVGRIGQTKNDSRLKSGGSFVWYPSQPEQNVRLGDSVYSGEDSVVSVEMNSGGKLTLGENSLVTFREINQDKIAELGPGNFRIEVNGKLKVIVDGKVTQLEGKNSQVQIQTGKDSRAQFRLLKGSAQVNVANRAPVFLDRNKMATAEAPKVEEPLPKPQEIAPYVWKLHDIYEQEGFQLFERDLGSQTPLFLSHAEPTATVEKNSVELTGQDARVAVHLESPIQSLGYVVQAASEDTFLLGNTRTFWTSSNDFHLSFYQAGIYYYRFRAVNQAQELSNWSETAKFIVTIPLPAPKPEPVEAPRLTENKKSKPKKKKQIPEKLVAKTESKEERKPSAVEEIMKSTVEVTAPVRESVFNEKYRNSRVAIDSFLWTLQSSQQYSQAETAPIAAGLGVRGIFWLNHSGFEARLKSAIAGVNQQGNKTAMKDYEARYHLRFHTGFPFSLARELQVSLFTGYEMFRNTGLNFANEYDLVKFGTSLEFPLGRRWETGGEVVYGMASDSSNKQEISGHLNYYFANSWSLGIGYRLHLFQAGSTATAPGLLPYREGYTEGYSVLDYHF